VLNLFFEEPDDDRWFPFDRYPRRAIRRVVRGKPRPGGQARVFLNLCAGLDKIGVRYRVNDYRYAKRNPDELACIVGKPCVLDKIEWKNPILFGAAAYAHPLDDPILFQRVPVKKILVPGLWIKEMWKPYWDGVVHAWPVGIDTDKWQPFRFENKTIDVLLYDKVRWEHDSYEASLIEPIRAALRKYGHSFTEIRYGSYREEEFHNALQKCRTMVFLCEHETQGIAYQQALSCNVPILAWDRGGYWRDPAYYPHKVKFAPVTSVPYWDERCGRKFKDAASFKVEWPQFWDEFQLRRLNPRDYITENLTLEKCAYRYMEFVKSLS
jgi:glycosyltransferase involved in cell wall biosynthesis